MATLARQLKKDEQAYTGITISMTTDGGRTIGYKVQGNTDLRKTDVYKLEIFDSEGTLLGEKSRRLPRGSRRGDGGRSKRRNPISYSRSFKRLPLDIAAS